MTPVGVTLSGGCVPNYYETVTRVSGRGGAASALPPPPGIPVGAGDCRWIEGHGLGRAGARVLAPDEVGVGVLVGVDVPQRSLAARTLLMRSRQAPCTCGSASTTSCGAHRIR
jgi:hypothetical protein